MPTQTSTTPGFAVGTVQYMSPEQALGKRVDQRSDLFSLGIVLYQMVTKRLPFSGSTPMETIDRILHAQPAPVTTFSTKTPPEFEHVIRKCLEKDPECRYQSAQELLIDLKNLKRDLDLPPGTTIHKQSAKSHKWPLVVAAIAILVLLAAWYFMNGKGTNAGDIHSIAVLPFDNISKNPDTEYLSDGITESLINTLSKISNLTVIARASVFRYKGEPFDPQKVAEELKVQAVLTGRVVQRGNDLSISAELVDARNNKHLWGEQYNQKLSDIFAMQEGIATTIARELQAKLTGEQQKELTKRYTTDPEAYQLYLKGRFYWSEATEQSTRKAIEYFRQAIEKDPGFALAYAGLADCYALALGDFYWAPDEGAPKAREAALKALQIEEQLAEPHTALGVIKIYFDHDWENGEKEMRRSIQLNPNYAIGHHQYGWLLAFLGRFHESQTEFKKALQLDPLSLAINVDQNVPYVLARNYEESIRLCKRAIDMAPNFFLAHFALGYCYDCSKRYDEALIELQKANELNDTPMNLTWMGYAYANLGKRAEALKVIEKLEALSRDRYIPPYNFAMVYAGLHDKEQTLKWLNKSYAAHDGWLCFLNHECAVDFLRSDPRFQELLHKVFPGQ